MAIQVGLNGSTVSGSITFGGGGTLIFGSSPIKFSFDASDVTLPQGERIPSSAIGPIDLSFFEDGGITAQATGVPSNAFSVAMINLVGQRTGNNITGMIALINSSGLGITFELNR